MKNFWHSLRIFIWFTILTGILYPLFITLIAHFAFNEKSKGDFIVQNGNVIGAKLISQKFENDKYFWPRPSAVDYNPLPSGGSNLGPTSMALKKVFDKRRSAYEKTLGTSEAIVPDELLFASGSGLDPHISPQTAYSQIDRIAKARNLESEGHKKTIKELIDKLIEERSFGFIGNRHINVLLLNKALDEL